MSITISSTSVHIRGRLLLTGQQIVLLMGGVLFVATVIMTVSTRETYDDPWILYRYASNLAAGYGWTFNHGSTDANAVTSPLMVLLLAAQIKVGFSAFVASSTIFVVGTWTAAQFAFLTLRSMGRPMAGAIAAALVVSSPWLGSLRGMESALLLGATAVALWGATTQRPLITGVSLGLAILARPDSVVLAACVLVVLTLQHRSLPLRESTALTCVVLPWLVYTQLVFHSLVPSTLAAKLAQRDSTQWDGLGSNFFYTVVGNGHLAEVLLTAPLALGGYVVMTYTNPLPLLPLVTASAVTFVIYEFVLGIAGYPWYAASIVYTALLLVALGLDFVAHRWSHLRMGAVAMAYALVALGILHPYQMSDERRDDATVAKWLTANTDPHNSVAAAEIGQLGYLSGLRMVDYVGLLDPQANSHMERQDWDWWVDAYHPDYWVTYRDHDWVVETQVLTSKTFRDGYRLVYRTPTLEVYAKTSTVGPGNQIVSRLSGSWYLSGAAP
jgi:hypothetical protein